MLKIIQCKCNSEGKEEERLPIVNEDLVLDVALKVRGGEGCARTTDKGDRAG